MSQQMNFEESNRQQQAPPFDSYEAGYRDPFVNTFGTQKVSGQPLGRGASAGQRLALAIVSICVLIPLSAIVLGIFAGAGLILAGLIGLGVVCFTIIAVNFVFNYKH
jgi:hypothetical protein